jgi:hypothetical protein
MDASIVNKHLRKPKGYARMDNPETLETVGTQGKGRIQTKQSKNNKTQRNITQ